MASDVMTASSAGSIPKNRQQVKDLRRCRDGYGIVPSSRKKDPLYSVMVICKESQGKHNADAFVMIVSCAPEPRTVLACDWTLNDLE